MWRKASYLADKTVKLNPQALSMMEFSPLVHGSNSQLINYKWCSLNSRFDLLLCPHFARATFCKAAQIHICRKRTNSFIETDESAAGENCKATAS